MGTIIAFPADAASRRPAMVADADRRSAAVVILPVVRIERDTDTSGSGPDQGAASGRRKRRRARS